MLEISRKWGMLSLALAMGAALVAGSIAVRPTQALADDGAEVAASGHAGRGRGAFEDELNVECVAASGAHERHNCLTLDKNTVLPIEGGWWLLEADNMLKNEIIEVSGDVSFVCSGPVDLGFGRIHVNKDAVLTLYYEAGTEGTTSLTGLNNRGVIESEGTVIEGGFPVGYDDGIRNVVMCVGNDEESHPVDLAGTRDLATQGSTLEAGTYVLSADKVFNDRLRLAGDVTIILREGVTLYCLRGIHVPADKTFTVDGEVGKMPTLAAGSGAYEGNAGIGGSTTQEGGGTVNIYGTRVFAKGGLCAAGIGAANSDHGDGGYTAGNVTICGSYVEATGNDGAAGIGGCREVNGGKVVIKRSTVKAWGGEAGAAGIGGGHMASAGPVEIIGSTVEATGGRHSAGIGGGGSGLLTAEAGNGGTVKIVDSKVTATGKGRAAGIGGGGDEEGTAFVGAGNGGDVTISGDSVVDATAGSGAAIGRGEGADGVGSVNLSANLRVVDFDNGGVIAPFDLRGEFCKYRNHVKVEPGESRK